LKKKLLSNDTVYGIFEGGEFVGMIELRDKNPSWELGYWLGTKYRGRGIMKEAVKLLVKSVKDRPVTAHIRFSNIASYKTLIYAGLHDDYTETINSELWKYLTT
jgi:RimJ/RimL family protein N-acetyltransferase